tara:strand:- start:143 stop:1222 length:1080 start_codon:yes stop_codon:yes gene_type:complete
MSSLKKTSLNSKHKNLDAKMAEFGGYDMPINYSNGIINEYKSVRENAGIFDVSHMGIFKLSGPNITNEIQYILTNNIEDLNINSAQYTLLCNDTGGVIDDLIIYKVDDGYILIVNASNTKKDFNWISSKIGPKSCLEDITEKTSLIAVQGPNSRKILSSIINKNLDNLKFYNLDYFTYNNSQMMICRTGYTGELGFEILGSCDDVNEIWMSALEKGIQPCGLASRDILRIEMGYCLYGHEIDETINPLASGLGWVIDKNKKFIGKDRILEDDVKYKLVAFQLLERGIPRQGQNIFIDDIKIGVVTSGTFSHKLNCGIGLCHINKSFLNDILKFDVDNRGKMIGAEIKKLPFINNTSLRK